MADYTEQQLIGALRKADAAGDAEAARAIARRIQSMRQAAPQPEPVAPTEVKWSGGVEPSTDPTQGMSGVQRFLAGAGKSVADTGLGLRQLGASVMDIVSPREPTMSGLITGQRSRADDIAAEVAQKRVQDAPLMETGAGAVGNVAGQVAQMAVPLGSGARLASMAGRAAPYVSAAGRAAAFTAAQPMAAGEDRATEALKAGALGVAGQGVASGLGALGRGVVASKPVQDLMAAAERAGIRLTPSQLSDSSFVRTVSSALNKLPFTGAEKVAQTQRAGFNRAVSRTFGEDAPAINSEVYGAAKRRIGGQFDQITARNQLPLGPEVTAGLREVGEEASKFAGADVDRAVTSAIDEVLAKAENGVLPGKAYQSLDSRLGKIMKAGGEKAHFVGQLRDVLRQGMDNSISATDRAAWGTAREQYKNLKTIRDLVSKETADGISPSQLMGRVNATGAGKEAMASGRGGTLGELAKLGQKIKDPVPDSGTAQRLLTYLALGGGSGYAAQSDNPLLSAAGKATLLGMAGGRALNSPALARALTRGNAPLRGLAKVGRVAPKALPAAASQGLVIDVRGGTPGAAISEEELEALRRGY
jgi:hypothetical protein